MPSTASCTKWRPASCVRSDPTTRFSPRPWSTRRSSVFSTVTSSARHPIDATSSRQQPRPCGDLVDHARRRRTGKRIGGRHRLPLDEVLNVFEENGLDIIALHEALDRLSERHERQGQVVTLRFLGGLSVAEVAEVLEVSITTVESDWRIARAWLRSQLVEANS